MVCGLDPEFVPQQQDNRVIDIFEESRNKVTTEVTGPEQLLRTPLHRWHVGNQGRMVDFAGWSMPVQYSSIIDEHHQTRRSVGMFDVSHMGRLYFRGTGIDQFLDGLTTRRVAGVERGKIRYSLLTNENGCILDDVLVYHVDDLNGQAVFMMVVNASNRQKVIDWIEGHLGSTGIELDDKTEATAMLAIQGPQANSVVKELAELDPESVPYYMGAATRVCGHEALFSRTGYTGEDGCELIVESAVAEEIWESVHGLAAKLGGGASGLAARDTLRLEAAMPLYGHELTEEINAAQTGLRFAMQFKNRDFVGKSSIVSAGKDPLLPRRVGLELEGRRAARENCEVFVGDRKIGMVTSGTFAPTLEKSISMGYVEPDYSAAGTDVTIDIRGKSHAAKVVELPFYSRA